MITEKSVKRFYAPYVNSHGKKALKGFSTRRQALRFLGKELLLDRLFGEKVELELGWGRPDLQFVSRDRDKFAALMRRKLFACYMNPNGTCNCGKKAEEFDNGFCRYAFNKFIERELQRHGFIGPKEKL